MARPAGPLSFLGRRLPPRFQIRAVAVAPGCGRAYDEADWRDALVVIERGEIELESLGGTCWRFARGDVLWLSGLPLRALHNRGREPALLVAVSRRRPEAMGFLPAGGLNSDDFEPGRVSALDFKRP